MIMHKNIKNIIFGLVLLVALVITNSKLFAQEDTRVYIPLQFENYNPVWQHTMIDTSIIGRFKGLKNNIDSIFYDGFTHLNSWELYNVKPVFHNGKVFIIGLSDFVATTGAFIQCLDITTGLVIWETAYDLRHDTRKEWPRNAYINRNGQLEILGHRLNAIAPQPPSPYWRGSLMTVRKYNVETGQLEERTVIEENDILATMVENPFSLFLGRVLGTYFFPYGDKYQYVSAVPYKSYILDSMSYKIDSSSAKNDLQSGIIYAGLYKTPENHFISIMHTTNAVLFENQKDSFDIRLRLYDRELSDLHAANIGHVLSPANYFDCVYANDDYFVLVSKEVQKVGNQTINICRYALFRSDGEFIEEITMVDENGNPLVNEAGDGQAMKLLHQDGMIIFTHEVDNESFNYLSIFKTDGKGNLVRVQKIKISDKNHYIHPRGLSYTPEGDILIYGTHINKLLIDDKYRGNACMYLLFTSEELGLVTEKTVLHPVHSLKIYPNPTKSDITIDMDDLMNGYSYCILNNLGQIQEVGSIKKNTIQIETQDFNAGIYFIAVSDKTGRIRGTGRFVKMF
jgi:hypothetical protein